MKVTLSLLALALATFTSALPQPQGVDEEPTPLYGGLANGEPKMAKRSPVAHGDKWDDKWDNKWDQGKGNDNPAYNPDDPSTYSQEYWNSIGSDYPKKRSPVAHGDKWDDKWDNKWDQGRGNDNPAYNPDDPSTYSQAYWNSIGSDNP